MADPIAHVVVLMLENRSFDQMLGCLQQVYPTLDGVAPGMPARSNRAGDGTQVDQAPVLPTNGLDPGPMHEFVNVEAQVGHQCGGFVADYAAAFPPSGVAQWQKVMGNYPLDSLPVLHRLGRSFSVCDHWFSSLPGPTWPNRFFVHSGTSLGHVDMPAANDPVGIHLYDQDTLYDRLEAAGVSWRIYHHGMPQSLVLLHQLQYPAHYRPFAQFAPDAAGPAAGFPAYVFIEPDYGGPDENDQHPPSDVMHGEVLLAQTYNALRANAALWQTTLLLVVYDEHGGFYDHVVPPAAVPPDDHTETFGFDQYGVRVPAILVSPWVAAAVVADTFDHTSLLRYLSDKWRLGPLGRRTAVANSFGHCINLAAPRSDTPANLPLPATAPNPEVVATGHTNALGVFAQFLEARQVAAGSLNSDVAREHAAREVEGAAAGIDVTKERFQAFLAQGR